jgi:TIR domain
MTSVFISYRRNDAARHAGRIADHFEARLGPGSVFIDVESIDAGAEFTNEIDRAIAAADAVLVVIGPRLVERADGRGRATARRSRGRRTS